MSSVSCIYGIGNPEEFHNGTIEIKIGDNIGITNLLQNFVSSLYSRTTSDFNRGNFRVKGDTVDIYPGHSDFIQDIFLGNEIEDIESFELESGKKINSLKEIKIYPANIFIASKERVKCSIREIQDDLLLRIEEFEKNNLKTEAKRIDERVNFDLEMIKELGYCSGIENYSRYFDGRLPGSRPFCLLDYFPNDFITIVDESHVTLPQIRAMYGGDKSRKINLVEHGFRLPSALDNRPLKFEEWETLNKQTIFVSNSSLIMS